MVAPSQLLDLQAIDSAIDRLDARKRALEGEGELAAARAQAELAERELGELRLSIDTYDRDAAKLEHEIDSITRKAADEQSRLYGGAVANVKELASIQHEVENLKKRKSEREDELLVVLERREDVERRAKEAEEHATELRIAADHVAGDAARELDAVDRGSGRTPRPQRPRWRPGSTRSSSSSTTICAPQKKGVAAVALVDGVCQGCHEKLSSVELDRVKRTEGIARCEYCRRILVL